MARVRDHRTSEGPDGTSRSDAICVLKVAVFSRILTDSSPNPTMVREVRVSSPLPKIESVPDVNFGNIGGKTFKGTSFDFDLSRKNEYVAGEYKVQVRLADGTDIGELATLTLRGDNEVEDRRSMVFDAKKKGVEKVDNGNGQTPLIFFGKTITPTTSRLRKK